MSKKNFSFLEEGKGEDEDEKENVYVSWIKKKFPKFALAIANPSEHYRYAMLKQGQFSDFVLMWNKKKYIQYTDVFYILRVSTSKLCSVLTGNNQLLAKLFFQTKIGS
jgi:hypothetical protein